MNKIVELNNALNKTRMKNERKKEKNNEHNKKITKNAYEYTCMFIEKLHDKLNDDKLKNKLTDQNKEWLTGDVMEKIGKNWASMTEDKKAIYISYCAEMFNKNSNLLGKYILEYNKDADDNKMNALVTDMITKAKQATEQAAAEKQAEQKAAAEKQAAEKAAAEQKAAAVRLAEAAASAAAAEEAIVAKAARQETGLRRRIKSDNKNLPPPPLKTTLPYDKKNQGGGHYFNPISRKRKVRSRSKTMKSR